MPYAQCPNCSTLFHVLVTDVQQWYHERHPTLRGGEMALEQCPGCMFTVQEGAYIYLIDHTAAPNHRVLWQKVGIVKAIHLTSSTATLYEVEQAPIVGFPTWRKQLKRTDMWSVSEKRDPRKRNDVQQKWE